jgi:Holliday junction resolvase RusA-like endonuclease
VSTISFFVPGLPAPGGSKRAFVVGDRAVVTEDCKRSKPWRSQVAAVANDAHAGPPLDGALSVRLEFVVARPRGHFGTGRNVDKVKPSAPAFPTVKPEVLKLARSTEDALTGTLWRDDCLTVRLVLAKRYGDKPGCLVTVRPMRHGDADPADLEPA